MWERPLVSEPLDAIGELRLYRRSGPPEHLAIEFLRESDGRAWNLRLPWSQRGTLRHLLADALWKLSAGGRPTMEPQGYALLARSLIAQGDEVVAVILEEEGDRAFALWRREITRRGEWSWTLDLVVVPEPLGPTLCQRILNGLEQMGRAPGE